MKRPRTVIHVFLSPILLSHLAPFVYNIFTESITSEYSSVLKAALSEPGTECQFTKEIESKLQNRH